MKFIVAATFLTVLVTSSNGQEWIPWKASQGVPKHAVPGGYEGALSLYVVRAPVGDEIAPGKYVTNHDQAYIPFWGEEKQVKEFEFFMAKNVKWVPAANGVIPPNAVVGGYRQNTEKLYIGRVAYKNSVTIGKIVPKNGLLYIPFWGVEYKFTEYEQLVYVTDSESSESVEG